MGDFLFTSLGPIYGNFFLMNVKYQPKKKAKACLDITSLFYPVLKSNCQLELPIIADWRC
jgi:hypothetical protein